LLIIYDLADKNNGVAARALSTKRSAGVEDADR